MEIEIKDIEACRKELSIRVPEQLMNQELDRVYGELRRSRRVAGFRPGKASRAVLEVHFGKEARAQVLQNQASRGFQEAVREEKLKVIGDPDFKEVRWDGKGELTMKVEVDLAPEIEPRGYQGIPLKKREVRVDDQEVEEMLKTLVEHSASFEVVEGRELREGDWAQIDYRSLKGSDASWLENAMLEIKPRDKFSSQMAGLKPGETRVVELELEPKNGEKSRFEVKLKEIKKKVLPELSDELASTWGKFKDLAEVREALRQDRGKEKEAEARKDLEDQVTEYLFGKNKFPLPPGVLERLTKDYREQMKRLAAPRAKNIPEEDYQTAARAKVEEDLRLVFLLNAIAAREKIKIDPRALGEEVGRLAVRQKVAPAELRNQMQQEGKLSQLEARLRRQQTMDFIIDNAKIK